MQGDMFLRYQEMVTQSMGQQGLPICETQSLFPKAKEETANRARQQDGREDCSLQPGLMSVVYLPFDPSPSENEEGS